jgi:hypothetical protein
MPLQSDLALIGKLVYCVGYMEWMVLGDLASIPGLPADLTVGELAGLTTGQIVRRIRVTIQVPGLCGCADDGG